MISFFKSIKHFLGGTVMAVAVAASGAAMAAPISLFNTGINASGVGQGGLALGGADTHYMTSLPTSPIVVTDSSYWANNATSQWIWVDTVSTPSVSTYTFSTTFFLTGLDATTARIQGLWGADNIGLSVLINETPTSISLPGNSSTNYAELHSFAISNGFYEGENNLFVTVTSLGGPGGFRLELTGTADLLPSSDVPEPGSVALVGLALAALGLARRKKIK